MRTNLTELAEQIIEMANSDLLNKPNVKCSEALIESLINSGFTEEYARKIVFRMKINVTSFDINNEDWVKIISNYAKLIKKLCLIVDDDETFLVVAQTLTLTYTF